VRGAQPVAGAVRGQGLLEELGRVWRGRRANNGYSGPGGLLTTHCHQNPISCEHSGPAADPFRSAAEVEGAMTVDDLIAEYRSPIPRRHSRLAVWTRWTVRVSDAYAQLPTSRRCCARRSRRPGSP